VYLLCDYSLITDIFILFLNSVYKNLHVF